MTPDEEELLETLGADFDDVDLAAFDGGEPPPCPPPAGVEEANRYLATLRHLASRLAEKERLAEAQIADVAAWHARVAAPLKNRYAWVERSLTQWAVAMNEDDPTRRTIDLPNGVVKVRPRQPRIETTGSRDAMEALRKFCAAFVREKLEPDKRALLAGVTPGHVAEGVDAPEGYEAHEAVSAEGERVPGVLVLLPTTKAVTVTLGGDR